MKRLLSWCWNGPAWRGLAVITLLFAGVVWAAAYGGTVVGPYLNPLYMKGGFFAGNAATASTGNRISTMKRCDTLIYDFPSVGGTMAPLDTYCAESSAATCTGVVFGDQLAMGVDQVLPGSGTIQPFVSAADAVKLRACANGITDAGAFNMPDASYTILWVH